MSRVFRKKFGLSDCKTQTLEPYKVFLNSNVTYATQQHGPLDFLSSTFISAGPCWATVVVVEFAVMIAVEQTHYLAAILQGF